MSDELKHETDPNAVARDIVPPYVRAFAGQEVKAVDESGRSVTHLITTGAVDRMGDVVDPEGADVVSYMKNPVVLANHDYTIESVIGRATNMQVGPKGIMATTVFRDTPLADAAFRLTREGLGGWSIGFRPTEAHTVKDGSSAGCKSCKARWEQMSKGKAAGDYVPGSWSRHYTGWEMLEYSSVAVPANQEIVNNAVQRGLLSAELVSKFFDPRSNTPEPAKAAAPGPKVEAVELHPVLAHALSRTKKRFAYAEVERALRSCLEKIHV